MRKIVVLLLTVIAIGACTSIDCPVQNFVGTNYAIKNNNRKSNPLDTDTLWIWSTRADGADTILLNGLSGDNETFTLPISYTKPEDVLYTLLKDTLGNSWLDTIHVQKTDFQHFESVDCQVAFFHEIKAVTITEHAFDSIVIKNSHVNYDPTYDHIYLYLKADR